RTPSRRGCALQEPEGQCKRPRAPLGGKSTVPCRRGQRAQALAQQQPCLQQDTVHLVRAPPRAASPMLCQLSISPCTRLFYSFCSAGEASCTAQAAPGRACMLLLALLLGPVTNPIYQRTEHCEAHQGRVLGRVERQARRRE